MNFYFFFPLKFIVSRKKILVSSLISIKYVKIKKNFNILSTEHNINDVNGYAPCILILFHYLAALEKIPLS